MGINSAPIQEEKLNISFNPKKNRNLRILIWIFIPIIVLVSLFKFPYIVEGYKMHIAVNDIKKFLPNLTCRSVNPKQYGFGFYHGTYEDCGNADDLYFKNEVSLKAISEGWSYNPSSAPYSDNEHKDRQTLFYTIQKTINGMSVNGEWSRVTGPDSLPGTLRLGIK